MTQQELTAATKQHYEDLIGELGEKYLFHRWGDHPVKRSHYRHTKRAIEAIFDKQVGQVDNLLEVGCGPGVWTDIMLQHAKKVTLFDISEEMLKVARNKYRTNANVKAFVQGDYIADANKLSEKFDVIFSARALEYMSDKKKMVTQSHELLKPGGSLIIITKNPEWHDKKREGDRREAGIQTDWIGWEKLAAYFRDAGFQQVSVYPVAQGSYHAPFNNRLGTLTCDLMAALRYRRGMCKSYNYLSESYLVYGKK
jgi:ubiquinone/menaquinone biosynthesis C-methylase UbiE